MPEPDDEDPTEDVPAMNVFGIVVLLVVVVLLAVVVGGVIGFTLLSMGIG